MDRATKPSVRRFCARAGSTRRIADGGPVPISRRALTLAGALACAATVMPGCKHLDPRCDPEMSKEQCLFYVAQLDDNQSGGPGTGDGEDGGRLRPGVLRTWEQVDVILREAADMLSRGLGGKLTAQQLTERCEAEPKPQQTPHGRAWACFLLDPPVLRGHEMSLEVGEGGVAGLTGFDFTAKQSDAMLADARKQWSTWCVGSTFEAIDTENDKDVYRCALPGGSQLVVGRFLQDPADLSADLWQVSLTVMGPG